MDDVITGPLPTLLILMLFAAAIGGLLALTIHVLRSYRHLR